MVAVVNQRRRRGRPKKRPADKFSVHVGFMAPPDLDRALEAYRRQRELVDRSDAVRDLIRRALRVEGLLKPE